jgi:hypothetical protein
MYLGICESGIVPPSAVICWMILTIASDEIFLDVHSL